MARPTRASVLARLAGGMAAFGSATPISKIVAGVMPVFVAAALRVALGAVTLAPFAFRHRTQVASMSRRDWLLTALVALFGMVGFTALMLYGMRLVSGVVGAIVMSTTPAVTAGASMLFLGDRPTWRKLTAIALAVAGVLVLHLGSSGDASGDAPVVGSLMIFGAVGCEAAYTLLGKRVSEHVDPVLVATLAAAMALPVFAVLAVWQWDQFDLDAVALTDWLALVWYGAGTLAVGTWLWYSGVAETEGAVAAGFMGVMPVSALVLSYVLLGEAFRPIHLIGFAIVGAGVVLMSIEHARMASDDDARSG